MVIYIIVCLLAIAVVAWGLLLFYSKNQVNKPSNLQTAPTASQTPTPAKDGQKSFQNNKLGVSFTYPSTWPEPVVTEKNIIGDNGYISFSEEAGLWRIDLGQRDSQIREGGGGYYWNIIAYGKKDYQQFRNSLLGDTGIYRIIKETLVNGNQAIIFTEGGMCGYKNAIIFGKNKTLIIESYCGGDDSEIGDKINDILENLKF